MTWLLCGLLLATAAAAPEQHCDASDPHCADTPSQDAATQSRQGRGESQSTTVNMVVFMTTAHDAVGEVRFNATVKTLAALSTAGIKAVVVDASPDVVREALSGMGATVYAQTGHGKAAALRQAAQLASQIPGVDHNAWLCFQEPEKTTMVPQWHRTLSLVTPGTGVVVPRRQEPEFEHSYAIEQWHSENFGNRFLNTVVSAQRGQGTVLLPPGLDWFFGPLAFRAKHATHWTEYGGGGYDSQLVPIVLAAQAGVVVADVPVRYLADPEMKAQEQGSIAFVKKRFRQLTALVPVVAAALEDAGLS